MFTRLLALQASAGSGKTFALAIRYICLLYQGANPAGILTLTFTNKSANEMKERISKILKNLETHEVELDVISKELELSKQQVLDKQTKIYDNFIRSDIKISTIDSFVGSILRKFSFYFGINPHFGIDFSLNSKELTTIFLQQCHKNSLYPSLIKFLSHIDTQSMFDIFDNLYAYDYHYNSKKNSFINQEEYKKSFYKLREYILNTNVSTAGIKAMKDGDILSIISRTWMGKESLKDYAYFKKIYTSEMDIYFDDMKQEFLEYILKYEQSMLSNIFQFYDIYLQSKLIYNRQNNKLTFDDVSYFVSKLLLNHINKEFFYFRLDAKVDHILLDEYQDTSFGQFEILSPLIEEIVSGQGVKDFKTFFYVGDVKQSIYRFRGANALIFEYTKELFDVKLSNLGTNYRSLYKVVEFVNSVFQDKIKGYIPQIPYHKNGGYVEYNSSEDIKELVSNKLKYILDCGANESDIAILVEKNKDAKELQEYINETLPDIQVTTEPNVALLESKSVKPLVEYLKYLYFQTNIHKINFNVLIGREFDSEVELCDDMKNLISTPLLIKNAIKTFDLSVDDNLLKFIELSYHFGDYESFLFNLDDISQKEIFSSKNKIKILTIHKSKGLEFDHVILMDSLAISKKQRPKKILYGYDGIKMNKVFYNIKARENIDKEYQNIKEIEQTNEYIDNLNKYYVGLTRAKNSIIMCAKESKSNFEFLGIDKFWDGKIQVKSKIERNKEVEFGYESQSYGLQNSSKTTAFVSEVKNLENINFGIALHYMLEMMGDFSLSNIDNAYMATKNRFANMLSVEQLQDIKNRVECLMVDEHFVELIANAKIYKEYPIYTIDKNYQIDLLIEKENKVIIVDYKSGKFNDSYIEKLEQYKMYLSKTFKQKINLELCFISKDSIRFILIDK